MDCRTFEEIAAAAADGRLPAAAQAAADAHLVECPRCREDLAGQRAARILLRRHIRPAAVPPTLRDEILRRAAAPARRARPPWQRRALLLGSIAAALLLAFTWLLRAAAPPPLLVAAERDVAAAESGELGLALRTADASALRRYYRAAGIAFAHSADDLEAQGLHLVGGEVSAIGAATTTRTLYDGPHGKVVCRRFRSGSVALPRGGEQVGPSRVFEYKGVRVAVTPIGDGVICSMASRLSSRFAAAAPLTLARRD